MRMLVKTFRGAMNLVGCCLLCSSLAAGCGGYAVPQTLTPSATASDTNTVVNPTVDPNAVTAAVTWANTMQALVGNSCGTCHPGVDATFDASNQASVTAAYADILLQVSSGSMPLPPLSLTAAQMALFVTWGQQNNP